VVGIVEKNVTKVGYMQVRADNTENLFTVADLSSVYIIVNIYESDNITSVQTGYPLKLLRWPIPEKYLPENR